ncbi:hypothetical protein [Pseudomonas huaxiensis]|uniref:hypothetical protein n=1 Tax=Pseudomonas huaxiensis TaxID=2213017 RepID=UPI0015AF4630|nr:hypothetical protein [Pseudomonas huaxiensis]
MVACTNIIQKIGVYVSVFLGFSEEPFFLPAGKGIQCAPQMAGAKHSRRSLNGGQPKKLFVQHARSERMKVEERVGLQEWLFSPGARQQRVTPSASIKKFHAGGLSIFC